MASGILRRIGVLFGVEVDKNTQSQAKSAIEGIKSFATKALGTIAVGVSIVKTNALAEEFTEINTMIKNATRGMGEQEAIQDKILEAANLTKTAYGETARMVTNLVQENSELFGTIDEAVKFNNAATMLFKTAGKTNDQIAGLMEAINNSFAKGAIDSETISQLLEQSPEAVKLLNERLGSTTDQLEQMATDGKITLEDLKEAFTSNADSITAAYMETGVSITSAFTLMRNQVGLFVSRVWSGAGVSTRVGKLMVRAFNEFMRVLNKGRATITAALQGALDWIERIADWISRAGSVLGQIIGKLGGVGNALKLAAIAAAALWIAFNSKKIITFLTGIPGLLKAAFSPANLKIMGIVAAIMLIVLAVDDLVNFLKGNESVIGTFFDAAGIGADNARGAIQSAWSGIQGFLAEAWNVIQGAAQIFSDTVAGFFARHGESIRQNFERAWGVVKTFLNGVWTFLSQLASAIFGDMESDVGSSAQGAAGKLLSAWQSGMTILSGFWDSMYAKFGKIFNSWMTIIETVFGWIERFWNAWGSRILSWFKVLWDSAGGVLNGFLSIVQGIVGLVAAILTGDWSAAWEAAKQIVSGAVSVVVNLFMALANTLSMLLSMIAGAVVAAVTGIYNTIVSWFTSAKDFVVSIFTAIWNFIVSIFTNIVSAVTGKVAEVKNAVVNGLTSAVDWIKELPSQALGWGSDMISGIADGIKGAASKVTDAVKGIADKIKSFLHFSRPDEGPLRDYEGWMPDFAQGLARTLRAGKPMIAAAAADIATALNIRPVVRTAQNVFGVNKAGNTVNQNININNTVQTTDRNAGKKAAGQMEKSSKDITKEVTRGLAYGRA